MKRLAWLIAILAVIALIWAVIVRLHPREAVATASPDIKVARAVLGDFAVRVPALGRVGAPAGSASSLTFAVPGILQKIDVSVGEHVVRGQALAELDAATYVNAVNQAQGDAVAAAGSYGGGSVPGAAFASARAKLESAATQADLRVAADQRALERERTLYAAGVAAAKDVQAASALLSADQAQARADHEQARSDVRSAQAQFDVLRGQSERAQAALAQAQRDLGAATLRAPANGVVMAILKHPGEAIDSASVVVVLGPPSTAIASLYLPGSEARGVRPGDHVDLSLTRSSETSNGVVTAVVPAVDPNTQESTVVVRGVPSDALTGDAVHATIVTETVHAVIVPMEAVVQDPQSGDTFVFVRSQSPDGTTKFEARKVTVRVSDAEHAAVSQGLRSGEDVAAKGAFELLSVAGATGGP
jgi:macrolide-specific efflux system membrane fusion protein